MCDVVVVVGVARSGTSCVSGMLERLGVVFDDGHLLEPTEFNTQGYFESRVLNGLLDKQIQSQPRGEWQDREVRLLPDVKQYIYEHVVKDPSGEVVGIKDTRLVSCGVPFIRTLVEGFGLDVRVVCTRRSPLANSRSLESWHDKHKAERLSRMLNMHLRKTRYALQRLCPVLQVSYEQVVKQPEAQALKLARFVGADENLVGAAASFVDPSLNHHGRKAG